METRSSPSSARNGQFHERKRNGRSHTNERGCCTILSISLSLSLVPLDSRFQFNADPSASPPKLDRFFVRAIVRSFARFLNLVKRDWKLCSFVDALQRLAAGNSAKQILRTRNWLDSISEGREGERERSASTASSS